MSDAGSLDNRLRPMAASDLERVRAWRNHADVRRHMLSTHVISAAEHRGWFEQCSRDERRHLLIFETRGNPRGFVSFAQVDGGIADWGFYAAPDGPRGSGAILGMAAIRHAFEELGLHKLCGQALAENERSIRLHLRLGFRREGVLREQHFDSERYHDMVCFGLLRGDWLRREQ